ncbi:MAG: family 16 glycosylhydrolase, partial [Chthoniobacterales bacterium]
TLTVVSNDKETADQNIVVTLATKAVNLSDDFNGTASLDDLGWQLYSSTADLLARSATTVGSGQLEMNVNSSNDTYPWYYGAVKTFASPGTLDLSSSSLTTLLRASGKFTGTPTPPKNKVQVRLESLNNAGGVTGSIALGTAVDETTAGATPGSTAYFTPDGITDRWAILLPEGGSFTSAGGTLASTGRNTTFDPNAPAFRFVLQMTDFEFDLDSGNIAQFDSINLTLATKAFELTNGGFESDATDPGTGTPPSTWSQYPLEGVSKNVVASGDSVYSASLGNLDPSVIFAAYAGTKAMKVYGQNYYPNGVWQGPSQTGTVYQEFQPGSTPGLAAGTAIHARGVAKVFSIDPLTGGSTFNFGFKYLDGSDLEIGRNVTSITASTMTADQWVPLTANGTVPVGAVKVQLISEFVQNASTDKGSVYLDDLSVGYGAVTTSTTIGTQTYKLAWSDEFDGSALNAGNWTPELGAGGWGNNEEQTYTSNTNNLRVENGNVIIDAIKSGGNWTSARIKTQDKRSFKYGLIEFRAQLPTGVGPWPAAWMMGTNISTVGWPACGEIDVMEWRGTGSDANTVGQATHSTSRNGGNPIEVSPRPTVSSPSTTYHTYGVLWEAGKVTFRVDGVTTGTWASPDSPTFEKEFFLLLNLAMGGSYVNNTIDSSLTSARYSVDYVRVFQTEATGPSAPATPTFSSVTSTGFTVNWGAVSGATSYRLDVSSSSSFASYTTQDLSVSGTSQAVTGLSPGTTYYARVRAVNSSGTSTSSPNGTQATLTAYQQYLQTAGISTSTAFGADGNGDGIPEGIKYSFGAALPMAGSTAAKVSVAGSTVTYAFDLRDDATLVVEPWFSGDLSSAWTKLVGGQNGYSGMSTTQGVAPQGFVRKTVTFTTPYTSKTFLRLKVNQQ